MLGNIKALAPHAEHYWGDTGAYFNRIKFDNGYGASVVSHQHSYGGRDGLFEVAVIDAQTEELVYDTPITTDVLGRLTFGEVAEVLGRIAGLAPANN